MKDNKQNLGLAQQKVTELKLLHCTTKWAIPSMKMLTEILAYQVRKLKENIFVSEILDAIIIIVSTEN